VPVARFARAENFFIFRYETIGGLALELVRGEGALQQYSTVSGGVANGDL
jgi:hypothetical protein